MWPWAHAAVAYLCAWIVTETRRRKPPGRAVTVAALAGSQFPDAVDKPLSWSFHVLPTGRSLAHSLLVAIPVALLAIWLARRYDRPMVGVGFGVGYLSAVLTDLPASVFAGDLSRGTFLLWPLLPSPTYDAEPSFVAHLTAIEPTGPFVMQLAAGLVVGVLVLLNYRRVAAVD